MRYAAFAYASCALRAYECRISNIFTTKSAETALQRYDASTSTLLPAAASRDIETPAYAASDALRQVIARDYERDTPRRWRARDMSEDISERMSRGACAICYSKDARGEEATAR